MRKSMLFLVVVLFGATGLMAVQPDSLINVYKTDVAPVIDGVLDSTWVVAQPLALSELDQAKDAEFLSGESIDYGAWMRIMWDDENLYIFADMMDDQTVSVADEGYNPDKFELHFDGDNSGGYTKEQCADSVNGIPYWANWMGWMWSWGPTVYDSTNDVQLHLPLGDDTLRIVNVGWGFNMKRDKPGFDFSGAEFVSIINENEDGYKWEIAIPWTALNLNPADIGPGYELGFNPTTNDCDFTVVDTAGALIKRHYSLLNTNNASWIYPTALPTLHLTELVDDAGTKNIDTKKWQARIIKTDLAPEVDGVIDSVWTHALSKSLTMIKSYDTTYVKDNFDTRAWMKAMWDDTNLYLLFNVIDDIVLTTDLGYADKSDEIELYFNGDNLPGYTKEQCADSVNGIPYWANWMGWQWSWGETVFDSLNDVQIRNFVGDDTLHGGNVGWGLNMRRDKENAFDLSGMQIGFVKNNDEMGYVVEYAIPWAGLNMADLVEHGHKFGFNADVVDGDDDIVNSAGEIRRKKYSWVDNGNASWIVPTALGTFELIDPDVISNVKNDFIPSVPKQFALEQNFPNPFNPTTTIAYHLKDNARVSLDVINLLGQKIRTLVSTHQVMGEYHVAWDGKDMTGQTAPSGIYFYKLNAESASKSFTEVRKMTLIK